MKTLFILFTLLAFPAVVPTLHSVEGATVTFPPCSKGQNINQVWKDQNGNFWWCSGSAWSPVSADGGTQTLNSLTVNGPLTVKGQTILDGGVTVTGTLLGQDAGFADNVYVAGTLTSGGTISTNGAQLLARSSSFTQFSVGTAGTAYLDVQSSGVNLTVPLTVPVGNSANKGIVLLDGGTPTVTVLSNALCVCGLVSADAGDQAPKCPVASTTMTPTGTQGDTIVYHCF